MEKEMTASEMGKKSASLRFANMTPEQISEHMRKVRANRKYPPKLPIDRRS